MASTSHGEPPSSKVIWYLYHHVFLPPDVPLEDDYDSECEASMLRLLIDALGEFKKCIKADLSGIIDPVMQTVANMSSTTEVIGSAAAISEDRLLDCLKGLSSQGNNHHFHASTFTHANPAYRRHNFASCQSPKFRRHVI